MKIEIKQHCNVCNCKRAFEVETSTCIGWTTRGTCPVCGASAQVNVAEVSKKLQEIAPPEE